ncbi:MAG: phosphoribosylformylglycinamidine synthase I [Candidatus Marinimicrobia bacterium]|nr:phosphoribosylformylglycinamidine synthase I [Candidatus Neomarinimicrobiota bacterium]|tara:strand:- start:32034 stop:32687 length:654 start_codon:yes stop_codon:yes gene_type:complete
MKFAIIVFPGSNCDNDAYYALKNIGFNVSFVWHKDTNLSGFDGILIPGGFSYGDYLRTGAIAKFSPIMKSLIAESKKGKIVIGICNGFQILIESGLLPGALITNKNIKFISKTVSLKINSYNSVFTKNISKDRSDINMPIAHKQGNYIVNKNTLEELEQNDQIIFKYKDNPNGSISDIAGITNKNKNILGMMPHPERASDGLLGSNDGRLIFESILG